MSHSRRTPCCESEAIRYLQEETVLMTGHEGAWLTTDSLAAALLKSDIAYCVNTGPWTTANEMAAAIIQATKEAERE